MWLGAFCTVGGGSTIGEGFVSWSRASLTTSCQFIYYPVAASLAFLAVSTSLCMVTSSRTLKQCNVASSLLLIYLRYYSTRKIKFADPSSGLGYSPKKRAFSCSDDSPKSPDTTPLKWPQL